MTVRRGTTRRRMRDTIIFDGEGVVVDSEKLWDRGQEEFLRRRGIAYDREKIKPLLAGRSMLEGVRILQAHYGFGGNVEALAKERVEIVKTLFAQKTEFIPGFESFYRRLPPTFKTCIATVMPKELLDIVIAKLALREFFGDRIYDPESEGLPSKPEPDLFLYAAKQLRSSPTSCVVIEDSPNGLEAAKRANMFSIGIATTFKEDQLAQADLVVRSFADIPLPNPDQKSTPLSSDLTRSSRS
jgi:beta-phosphoglucomutase